MNKLSLAWWLQPPFDLEHKQYVLLAYIRDVKASFDSYKLVPYFDDVRAQLKNIESYSTIGGITKKDDDNFTKKDIKNIEYITSMPDNNPDKIEVNRTVQWSLDQLRDLHRHASDIWKFIENSLTMTFVVPKPKCIKTGYLFIRYPGSWIVETYKFDTIEGIVVTEFVQYDENKDARYDDVIHKYSNENGECFIAVEPSKPFDTKLSLLPVVHQVLKSKVITK